MQKQKFYTRMLRYCAISAILGLVTMAMAGIIAIWQSPEMPPMGALALTGLIVSTVAGIGAFIADVNRE